MMSYKPPVWQRPNGATGYRRGPDCRHGADCVKYGCAFTHPPHRRQDCEYGRDCSIPGCKNLHPLSSLKHPTSVPHVRDPNDIRAKLQPGTIVLCKRQPFDPVWMSAKLIRLVGKTVTVKLEDSAEPENMPLSAIRCPPPKTPCRHGVSCVKFGCMFIHPEGRRKDCPRGASCRDVHCVHLHPVTRNGNMHSHLHASHLHSHFKSTNNAYNAQPQEKLIYTNLRITTNLDSERKNNTLATNQNAVPVQPEPVRAQPEPQITTSKAEAALHLLIKAVDSNEEFLQNDENRRLLEILGLKAKKKQAVLNEEFLSAHEIKVEIDNLRNTK